MNNAAYKKLDYSLALLSTAEGGKNFGCIINSLHQVTSSRPPKFTFSLNNDSATCAALKKSGVAAEMCIRVRHNTAPYMRPSTAAGARIPAYPPDIRGYPAQ